MSDKTTTSPRADLRDKIVEIFRSSGKWKNNVLMIDVDDLANKLVGSGLFAGAARSVADVERVARAICESAETDNFDGLPDRSILKELYRQQARAAIAAMGEPTHD